MEYTREIKISIYKDTNKDTYEDVMKPYEGESIEEFVFRVKERLDELLLNNN